MTKSDGLVFTPPLHPSTTTYRLWDENTAAAFPLSYKGTATVHGRHTYRYASAATGTVASPASARTAHEHQPRPADGPGTATGEPAAGGAAESAPGAARLAARRDRTHLDCGRRLDRLRGHDDGRAIRVQRTQRFPAGISLLGQTVAVPVCTLTLATTSGSEATTAPDASSDAASLTLVGRTIPLVLLIFGVVFLAVAVVLAVVARRRPGGTAPASPIAERTPTPV